MRLTTLLSVAVLIASASASAQVSIPILNPVFSEDQLSCSPGYYCAYAGVTGWSVGPETGVFKASTAQFKLAPPEGLYVAYVGSTAATGSILQTLGDSLQANATYVLTVTVGARADYPFTGYEAAFMAGDVTLTGGNKATPVGGSFATEVLLYSSGPTPAQLGKPLQILIKSLGTGQVEVAAVTLTVE